MSFIELLCKLGLHKFTVLKVGFSSKESKFEEVVCSRCGFQTKREKFNYTYDGGWGF